MSHISQEVPIQERIAISSELQSLKQDTQGFRTEAYRLRTAGALDAATNEQLRAKQRELERRGDDLVKRLSPGVEWKAESESPAVNGPGNELQPPPPSQLSSSNSLQLMEA
ncbi:hypothetical protein BC834DRAFT_971246 [Gloeopeniophorella convolvens]|nr:hypothetical protein BC834DRAFT_971246 [Gloeopeniophorella convolvens]